MGRSSKVSAGIKITEHVLAIASTGVHRLGRRVVVAIASTGVHGLVTREPSIVQRAKMTVEYVRRRHGYLRPLLGGDEGAGDPTASSDVGDGGPHGGQQCSMLFTAQVRTMGLEQPATAEVAPHHFFTADAQDSEVVLWLGKVIIQVGLAFLFHPANMTPGVLDTG